MVRKLFLALALVGVSLAATTSYSEPCCDPEPVNPCDVVCEAPGATLATVCECPCWTDRRVIETDCDRWNGVGGCWYLE